MYYLDLSEERFLSIEDLPGEKWVDVKGYENLYQISNWGRLKSKERYRNGRTYESGKCGLVFVPEKIRKIKYDKDGYVEYALSVGTHKKCIYKRGHRLVAEAFIPNPDDLPLVNHKNFNTSDCRAENLEWCDWLYNRNYSYENIKTKKRIKYNGFEYNSINECARALNIYSTTIRRCILKNTEYKGHKFNIL